MIDFKRFLKQQKFAPWREHFAAALAHRTDPARHGDLPNWLAILAELPTAHPKVINLNNDTVSFGNRDELSQQQQRQLNDALMRLAPWRKGPYRLFDSFIDTEWRSDWKWQRLTPHISNLRGRTVLDVGCGNGYHCWRMLGAGANYVLGIDPSMRFLIQNMAIQQYAKDERFDFLALGIEDMPNDCALFDSVFSMGVLYHRRQPINHLLELKRFLKPGGELILETLIVDNAENGLLQPAERYAQMRNVWSIMTLNKIVKLLNQAGFTNVRCVDQNVTSFKEQRQTDWMQFHSLEQFLDPNDTSKTIEGYPAPKRGLFIATK